VVISRRRPDNGSPSPPGPPDVGLGLFITSEARQTSFMTLRALTLDVRVDRFVPSVLGHSEFKTHVASAQAFAQSITTQVVNATFTRTVSLMLSSIAPPVTQRPRARPQPPVASKN
jgi:hypothetical protein